MGLLTPDERKEMAIAHGRLFEAVCDKCGRCIRLGAPYVVVKYEKLKRIDPKSRSYTWNRKVPKKIICLDCDEEKNHDIREEYAKKKNRKVIGGKRSKLTDKDVKSVNKMVRRIIISILKKSEEEIETAVLKNKILAKAKKKEPNIKKSAINATLRVLRKAKVVQCKKKLWKLVEEK